MFGLLSSRGEVCCSASQAGRFPAHLAGLRSAQQASLALAQEAGLFYVPEHVVCWKVTSAYTYVVQGDRCQGFIHHTWFESSSTLDGDYLTKLTVPAVSALHSLRYDVINQ